MQVYLAFLCAIAIFASGLRGTAGNVVESLGREITSDVRAVKQPIDETVTYVGSSQCENVKQIVGFTYDQLQGESEPDVNKLTLGFQTDLYTTIINITAAAFQLPRSAGYNIRNKVVIFVHGFTDDPSKESFQTVSKAYLDKGGFNVLALDGSSLIRWLYIRATTYIRFMGEKLGEVLAKMINDGLNPDDIHIVGHSLGSHISGFAGKTVRILTGRTVGRITGLDPAGPCFSNIDPGLRLQRDDASFVDVIHTDVGVFGLRDPVGHIDFYPNGGNVQPNCFLQTCSHSRAWRLYSYSIINPTVFPAKKCLSWNDFKKGKCTDEIAYMGYAASPGQYGTYYLVTSGEPPFGLGVDGLTFKGETGVINRLSGTVQNKFPESLPDPTGLLKVESKKKFIIFK